MCSHARILAFTPPGSYSPGDRHRQTSMEEITRTVTHLINLTSLATATFGIGGMDTRTHANASCAGWPQCSNVSDPSCGCFNYGWDQQSMDTLLNFLLEKDVHTVSVWRGDITPPPGTTPQWPTWYTDALARFLAAD